MSLPVDVVVGGWCGAGVVAGRRLGAWLGGWLCWVLGWVGASAGCLAVWPCCVAAVHPAARCRPEAAPGTLPPHPSHPQATTPEPHPTHHPRTTSHP